MDRKQMCVANVQYKRPGVAEARRAQNLLKYLTYRDSRSGAVRMVAGQERWVDHGMGHTVTGIARRCDDLKSDHVLLFSLVVNPNPDLVALVPAKQRERFVRELTEATVEEFFEARGVDTGCEYSYVVHHRVTDDAEAPGRANPHAHVVLPGTLFDEAHGARVPLYFSRNRHVNHIDLLHSVTEASTVALLERYAGPDWEQRHDALAQWRAAQRQVMETAPTALLADEAGDTPVWCGVRCTDEHTAAVGYYAHMPDKAGKSQVVFRPLVSGLGHMEAEEAVAWVDDDAERLQALAEAHSEDGRAALRFQAVQPQLDGPALNW